MRTGLWILLGFVVYVSVRVALAHFGPGFLIDDAYITLRYVHNLVEEGSFTYHVGERIFGISTILYALLLALVQLIVPSADLVTIDIGVNIGLEYLCLLVLTRLFFVAGASVLFACGLALVTLWNPLFLSASQGGMETPLYVLWLLLAMVSVDLSMMAASVFAGMALLTRPEGSVPMAIVGLINLLRRGKFIIYVVLGMFAVAFAAFYYLGFGTLYPASVEIKHLIGSKDPLKAFVYFLKAPALLIPLGSIPWPVSLVIVLAIVVYGAVKWPRRWSRVFALGVATLNFALYSVANPPVWYWYPAPMTTLLAIFFFWGLYSLLLRWKWAMVAIMVLVALLDVRWTYFTKGTLLDVYTHRVQAYYNVVKTLKDKHDLTPEKSIFTHEIGAIGYYSGAHIYDAVGLVNPSLAKLGLVHEVKKGVNYGLATRAFLEKTDPDYIIIQKNLIAPDASEWDAFHENYSLILEVPDTAIDRDSGDIEVYKKH
ncbi:MAG: hypothetical protein Q8K75_10590 [Chlamydiales bacterium]|nr:hypothetical protein [Chlamydiales bacterium]